MSFFFNTSGLITRGLGEANKILTRGFGNNDKLRGLPPNVNRTKEYIFEIKTPVIIRDFIERNIIVQVKRIINKTFNLKSGVNKKVSKSVDIKTKVDSKRLFHILDAI